jgi:hypothetical protein
MLQKQNKKPKARTATPGKQTETQAGGFGSSLVPARPRPRARKIPSTESEVTVHDKEQSAESSRPKPHPRTKTHKETAEEREIVDSEPILAEKGKGKGKQKAATVASSEAKPTRKRKRRTGDNILDNLPSKRKKVGSVVVPDNQAEAVATRQVSGDDETSLATARALGQGEEATSTKVKGDARGKPAVRAAEPTRRQPSRAAARKSIS